MKSKIAMILSLCLTQCSQNAGEMSYAAKTCEMDTKRSDIEMTCKMDTKGSQQRKSFLSKPVSFVDANGNLLLATALVNTELSNYYGGIVPKTTVLMDYPKSANAPYQDSLLVIQLESAFEATLPASLRAELASRGLLNKGLVKIFVNVQGNYDLGEEEDHQHDGSPLTTRLKAHGGVDPDGPAQYSGTRYNKNVQIGIYDADFDISDEVPLNALRSFNVHLHDSVFSPRNARIKLGKNSPSQSFWSLALDDRHTIVTLHWVLDQADEKELLDILYQTTYLSFLGRRILSRPLQMAVSDVGDLLGKLSDSPTFKNKPMLNKLNALFL